MAMTPARLLRAADTLVQGQFAVAPGESVLITGDSATEPALLDAIAAAVVRAGARPLVALAPQLPFQGGLSDPYVSDGLKAAAVASDVWFDLLLPLPCRGRPRPRPRSRASAAAISCWPPPGRTVSSASTARSTSRP